MAQPDLERYLQELADSGVLGPDDVLELQDHLWSSANALEAGGLSTLEARARALEAFGPPDHITLEYKKVTPMKPISRVAGISIACVMLGLSILPTAQLSIFVHIPSLVLVLGLVSGGLIASFGPVAILRCLRQASTSVPPGEPDVEASVRLTRHGYRLCWAAGVVGVLVGVVLVLQNLADPTRIGSDLALSLLTLLYGALLAELGFSNLEQWLIRPATSTAPPAARG